MSQLRRLSQTLWHCQDHIVWVSKYRFRILEGKVATAVANCIRVLNKFKNLKKKPYWGNHSWVKGYCMDDRITRILTSLNKSTFRSRFKLNEEDLSYIRTKGVDTIRSHAVDFITSRIAPRSPKNDGKQTPMRGHPAFIAQHATATCCRGCVQKWHGIEKGKALTHEEIDFLVDLIMAWIEARHTA